MENNKKEVKNFSVSELGRYFKGNRKQRRKKAKELKRNMRKKKVQE